MIQRTTTTPAGEEVFVLTDADVMREASLSKAAAAQASSLDGKSGLRRAVVADLWLHGAVEDRRTGRCTQKIADRIDRGTTAMQVGTILRGGPVMDLILDRETNGKRTYTVRLTAVLARWLPHLERLAPVPDDPPVPTPVPVPAPDAGPTTGVGPGTTSTWDPAPPFGWVGDDDPRAAPLSPVEGRLADAVATALLAQVVEIIATRDDAAPALGRLRLDVEALEERLGTQVGYVDKLRRELREAGDQITALKMERDGLRTRLRSAEHNLKVATSADARRIIDDEVRRRVADVMRETPSGPTSRAAAHDEANGYGQRAAAG